MKHILLDTDIGPDCDDVGALAMLAQFARRGLCRVAAVTHCTSNPYGAGCADAVLAWYGLRDVEVGTTEREGFLQEHQKYNRYITENYENRYRVRRPESAVRVLRRRLAAAAPGETVVCAIGPLNDLAELLASPGDDISPLDGRELVRRAEARLVSMAGSEAFGEYNVICDTEAARTVLEDWPAEVWLSPFELGADVMCGHFARRLSEDHVVCKAYALYTKSGLRNSWDLTAVWAAALGCEPLFTLSGPCRVQVRQDGVTEFLPHPEGRVRIMGKAQSAEAIAAAMDAVIDGSYSY